MLSDTQIDHYRTFGFVVLPAFLGDVTRPLADEVNAAIIDAYQTTDDQRDTGGISGHYLPMASRYTPHSASLICDDPCFIRAAEALIGGRVIPECPEGVLYFFDAGWHNDDGMGVEGVKFATYFDALEADSGALRFIPGSQRREHQPRLCSYRQGWMRTGGRDIDGCPVQVTATNPGDVVAFDLHTWHASFGGRDRLAWTITYQRCPETAEQRERTLRSMLDSFEQSCRGFDRNRYPIWRDWLADSETHPRRRNIANRLRASGVLDLDGAEFGW
jgi:hypothetical protein